MTSDAHRLFGMCHARTQKHDANHLSLQKVPPALRRLPCCGTDSLEVPLYQAKSQSASSEALSLSMCVRACVCACVRACMRACVCVCVRAYLLIYIYIRFFVSVVWFGDFYAEIATMTARSSGNGIGGFYKPHRFALAYYI